MNVLLLVITPLETAIECRS